MKKPAITGFGRVLRQALRPANLLGVALCHAHGDKFAGCARHTPRAEFAYKPLHADWNGDE